VRTADTTRTREVRAYRGDRLPEPDRHGMLCLLGLIYVPCLVSSLHVLSHPSALFYPARLRLLNLHFPRIVRRLD
jgi:hypothetical protein